MNNSRINININFKILPFGYVSFESKNNEIELIEKENENPIYMVPKTTNPQLIEIAFNEENYIIPKSTCGFL